MAVFHEWDAKKGTCVYWSYPSKFLEFVASEHIELREDLKEGFLWLGTKVPVSKGDL